MLAQMRALDPKANKAEKVKNAKGGHRMWTDVSELGEMIRAGTHTWEDLDLDDVDVRLKWAGLFHRKKRAPGTFMMRLKVRTLLLCSLGSAMQAVGDVCSTQETVRVSELPSASVSQTHDHTSEGEGMAKGASFRVPAGT